MRPRMGMAVIAVVVVAVIVIVIVAVIVAVIVIVVMAGAFVAMAVGHGGLALRGAAACAGVVMPAGRSRGVRAAAGVRPFGSGGIGMFVRCARHSRCLFVSH